MEGFTSRETGVNIINLQELLVSLKDSRPLLDETIEGSQRSNLFRPWHATKTDKLNIWKVLQSIEKEKKQEFKMRNSNK